MSMRGINLGGWLVSERWMTPELFTGVIGSGERAIGRQLGEQEASRRLALHRRTFIQERDFAWLAAQGFDFVRLPVGYWLFEVDDGFVQGEEYVDRAFAWAKKHSLGIVLDFHGLQGSQNGHDHSGQVGKVEFFRSKNMKRALATLEYIVNRYGREPALIGVEVVNEPKLGWCKRPLLKYYDMAAEVVASNVDPSVSIILSDAYQPLRIAKTLAGRGYGSQLVLDVHLYQLFSDVDRELDFDGHLDKVQTDWRQLLMELNSFQRVLVGEWSAALPAELFVGVNETQRIRMEREYYVAQRKLFDEWAWAECYWSYKTQDRGVWSYRNRRNFGSK